MASLRPTSPELAGFGQTILTTPELDFVNHKRIPVPFDSSQQLVNAFDDGASKVRTALKNTADESWTQPWKLSFNGKPIFSGSRFLAYRQMFINHLVHHGAQLGVYLRLNDVPYRRPMVRRRMTGVREFQNTNNQPFIAGSV